MKNNFNPFISDNKVIVDLAAKIDILVDDDIYIVSKNSKPLYFFEDSANAVAFALLMYLECIDYSFMTSKCLTLTDYFSKVDKLITKIVVHSILYEESKK